MNESDGAVSARLKETAGSLRDLWVYVALAASTVSLFGNAALQVTLFEVFMGIYRTPTYAVYNALDWPHHFGLPYEKLVRDITTVVLVTVAFTIANLLDQGQTLLRPGQDRQRRPGRICGRRTQAGRIEARSVWFRFPA